MNQRSIQHPGIEIREIDMTEYKDVVTTNNAYVIGFTDRGPIYDYSWITTRSEFINLYGEPQTEAEKYLYYAVQSVLNNGGTPIVGRMPYDNKQCKAYKALKIKYASYMDDPNAPNGFNLYTWEENPDVAFNSGASALIELDRVGKYLKPTSEYKTVYDVLCDQDSVNYINYVDGVANVDKTKLTSGDIGNLTYKDLLYNLSPVVAALDDLNNNDNDAIDNLYADVLSGTNYIKSIEAFVTVPVHPENLKYVNTISSLNAFANLNNAIASISGDISNLPSSYLWMDLKNYPLTVNSLSPNGILNEYITAVNNFISITGKQINLFVTDKPNTIIKLSDKQRNTETTKDTAAAIDTFINTYGDLSFMDILGQFKNNLINLENHIVDCAQRIGKDLSSHNNALVVLDYLKIFLNTESDAHESSGLTRTPSGLTNLLNFSGMEDFFSGLDNYPFNGIDLSDVINGGDQLSGTFSDLLSQIDQSTPLSGNFIDSFINYVNDAKANTQEHYKSIAINGKNPADLGIPSSIINGLVNSPLSGTLSNTNISDSDKDKDLIKLDKTLVKIYNDPFFKEFDGTEKGQAIVDANLLQVPELGFEYGVYLDSQECEISNEQYDDLVTTNRFTKEDIMVSKYGSDISNANFVIVDKQKTIVDGIGSNVGYFVTIVDPFDAIKMQRLMTNPAKDIPSVDRTQNKNEFSTWGNISEYKWNELYKTEINTLNTLQRVKNADGMYVGEPTPGGKTNQQLLDSWSVPLVGNYYDESISKSLMNMFPQIPLTDVANDSSAACIIDKQYTTHIVVAVCKTVINPSDGKITVTIVEQFFGSLFDEKNIQNGRDLFIGNIINANSNYIEFYRNNYIKPAFGGGMDPEPYNRIPVAQFFIKNSKELNDACKMVGIDVDKYDVDNIYTDENGKLMSSAPTHITESYDDFLAALKKSNIFVFDKATTILYNHHPQATFTSFSKKESQKIIANTTGLFGQAAGTTANIGDNFIVDMDRCINFIKNVDDIPIYFVADAGLSTIAQFCDNVVWDQTANNGAGKWVTQQFDPDNDPDGEDRYITDYTDVATWRKVIDKLDQVSREIRRDCMTIIDAPRQLTLDGAATKIRRSKPQNNWDSLVGDKLKYISGINSSYTAGYYNWLRTTDEFSGKSFWLPPTCKIIGNYMYLNAVNLPWLAPAGLSYGILSGIHGISHNPSPNEEDQIYLKSWNYIKQYPFDGFIIEGQKTTLTKNSAFNRVNVRTLFLDLERFVYNVARNFKYQVNNAYTREQFVQTIKPKFEDYMIRGGLYDYLIICDDTNNTPETIDANELRVAIYLKPARLIEYIMIDFIAAKTGANFNEIII